jgi:hypothetical protein
LAVISIGWPGLSCVSDVMDVTERSCQIALCCQTEMSDVK